jgi:hypothetical protein
MIRRTFDGVSVDLEEIADFWLEHHNFQPADDERVLPWRKARDAARGAREVKALRIMAKG